MNLEERIKKIEEKIQWLESNILPILKRMEPIADEQVKIGSKLEMIQTLLCSLKDNNDG